ncbi:MAG: hypothetical protein V1672_03900 [Candidatus Diapherotrites archaeon]
MSFKKRIERSPTKPEQRLNDKKNLPIYNDFRRLTKIHFNGGLKDSKSQIEFRLLRMQLESTFESLERIKNENQPLSAGQQEDYDIIRKLLTDAPKNV